MFDGQLGYLDYALAGTELAEDVTGAAWQINADEAPMLDYNVNFKSAAQVTELFAPDAFRSSDHDPVIVGIDLDARPADDHGDGEPDACLAAGKPRTVTITVDAADDSGEVTVELVSATAREQEGGDRARHRHHVLGRARPARRLHVHVPGDGCRRQHTAHETGRLVRVGR